MLAFTEPAPDLHRSVYGRFAILSLPAQGVNTCDAIYASHRGYVADDFAFRSSGDASPLFPSFSDALAWCRMRLSALEVPA